MKAPGAGYSGTPLWKKLGLKSGMRMLFVGAPANLDALLTGAPRDLVRLSRAADFDCALAFAGSAAALQAALARLEPKLAQDGMLWCAWPKKASGVATDLTEDTARSIGLDAGLVDIKVCAIDATWSGLRFVRRVRDRRG